MSNRTFSIIKLYPMSVGLCRRNFFAISMVTFYVVAAPLAFSTPFIQPRVHALVYWPDVDLDSVVLNRTFQLAKHHSILHFFHPAQWPVYVYRIDRYTRSSSLKHGRVQASVRSTPNNPTRPPMCSGLRALRFLCRDCGMDFSRKSGKLKYRPFVSPDAGRLTCS